MYMWPQDRREEMLAASERAVTFWEGLRDHSMEAYKAHATLSVMVNRLKSQRAVRHAPSGFGSAVSSAFSNSSPMEDSNIAPEHSAAMTLGMLSTGALTPNIYDTRQPYPSTMGNLMSDISPTTTTTQHQAQQAVAASNLMAPNAFVGEGPPNASPFSSLFGSSLGFQSMEPPTADINWEAWDSYIQGATFDPNNALWPMDLSSTGMPGAGDSLMNGMGTNGQGAGGQQQGHSNQNNMNANAFGANVFMGL